MDCPRCKSALIEEIYHEQLTMRCIQCYGIMIKQRSLFNVIQKLSDELIYGDYKITSTEAKNNSAPVDRCPGCSTNMDHYGYMESKDAMIDVCPSCNWLWADPQELGKMTLLYIKSQQQYEKLRIPRDIDGVGVAALEAAFLAGLGLGSIF